MLVEANLLSMNYNFAKGGAASPCPICEQINKVGWGREVADTLPESGDILKFCQNFQM